MNKPKLMLDGVELKFPMKLEVRDNDEQNWIVREIECYDHSFTYCWITDQQSYMQARLIKEKKMIPWTIEDFKCGMVITLDGWLETTILVTRVSISRETIEFSHGEGHTFPDSLRNVLEKYRQEDGSKFEKEA